MDQQIIQPPSLQPQETPQPQSPLMTRLIQAVFGLFGIKSASQKGEWPDNVGPALDEHPPVPVTVVLAATTPVKEEVGYFTGGFYSRAKQVPMHKGRIGRAIKPQTLIVHTTDCKPGTFNAIVKSWTTQPGKGNGAHFLIGKNEETGIVQFCSTVLNANHAGGPNCGGIKHGITGAIINPNVCSVGVELDNAGRLKKDAKGWYHADTGYRFDTKDVFIDEKGRGWERVTVYQMEMLKQLWMALKPTLTAWPSGTVVAPNASYVKNGAEYAMPVRPSLIGHASTNVINKTDPGPQVMAEINKWA